MAAHSSGRVLRVDPIACVGHGLCAELVGLDEWGYPLLDRRPVPGELLPQVRQAVAACPTLALRLQRSRPAGER
ncbi:MAG: ferredoxin [Pseudonocardiales bacterium]|nr:ferredoxin [Pseudonocardiales bacterium]MBV9031340.1 ferredoxin [Pseudonocardiales bacterium]MBW0010856.1 ferredoxin [Pseudonocardiales bacterium]